MAQHKYELITVDNECKGPKRYFPWYKERLKLKFLKSKQSAVYDSVNWTFVPSGTDDFRTGTPRNTSGAILRLRSNPVPLIGTAGTRTTRSHASRVDTGDRTLFNKEGPRRQLRREYLKAMELGLLRHPLGLYPHLTEAIPAEIVNDVVCILDPVLKKGDSTVRQSASCSEASLSKEMPQQSFESLPTSASISVQKFEERQSPDDRRPLMYKFPLMKTVEEKEREKDLLVSQQVISAKQQSRVNEVTRDLVQWGAELASDGTDDPVDEDVIRSLFGSDYETKPISMAPIQVVELDSVPNQLQTNSQQSDKCKTLYQYYGYQRVGCCRGEMAFLDGNAEQRVMKARYGAWYLPTRLWKLRHWDEPLKDPDVVAAEVESEQYKKQRELDNNLSELHGAKAFKEFIQTKKPEVAMPAFLNSVHLTPDWISRKS